MRPQTYLPNVDLATSLFLKMLVISFPIMSQITFKELVACLSTTCLLSLAGELHEGQGLVFLVTTLSPALNHGWTGHS